VLFYPALGVIGSPQLLLLSGVGPEYHLQQMKVNLIHYIIVEFLSIIERMVKQRSSQLTIDLQVELFDKSGKLSMNKIVEKLENMRI